MTVQPTLAPLPLGARIPEFSLVATDRQTYSLETFAGRPYLAVIFLANHCPYVSAWEDRILAIAREFASRGVQFVAISPNDAEKFPQDSFEKMGERVQEKEYPFPYLYDESQDVAHNFGATRTPEVFVFDTERRLRYHGAVDSDWEESSGMQNYLRDALDQLTETGLGVRLPQTPPVGCTIKYRE